MPAREREKVLIGLLELEAISAAPNREHKMVRWPDVEARAKRVFGKKLYPNLVMLEREEEAA